MFAIPTCYYGFYKCRLYADIVLICPKHAVLDKSIYRLLSVGLSAVDVEISLYFMEPLLLVIVALRRQGLYLGNEDRKMYKLSFSFLNGVDG